MRAMARSRVGFVAAGMIGAAFVLAPAGPSFASDAKVQIRAKMDPETLTPGERGRLSVDIEIPEGFHLWSLDPGPGPLPLVLQLEKGSPIELEGAWYGPMPKVSFVRGFQRELRLYEGTIHLERAFHLPAHVKPGELETLLTLRGQIC